MQGIAYEGLSDRDAAARLAREGPNELPSAHRRPFLAIVRDVLREPMLLMLLAGGGLYMALGDPAEALMLLAFVFVVLGITIYQERKTERALEALRDLSSPRALVIRDGEQRRIPARELVRDDVVLLAEGDRVPADGVLLDATNMSIDESLLTGESMPVRKVRWDGVAKAERPGGDDQPFVFSGTLVIGGQGVARVLATGASTEMGKIGKALQSLGIEQTPLQRQTRRIVRDFALVGLGLSLIIVMVYGATRGDWLHALLAGITLSMATLPEEFPMVLTIFLALGAWRISRSSVLARRVPAVETLGAATVLCVDKTGTLTLNRMQVSVLSTDGRLFTLDGGEESLPDEFHALVENSILASPADPFDPMEKAMRELGERTLANTEHLHRDWELIREYPLSEKLLAMSRVWRSRQGEEYVIAAKGAPEAIADLCHLDEGQLRELEQRVESMASRGLRVIGVARARFRSDHLPPAQHDFPFELVGLLGLADPIRPEVPAAVQECYAAGIRVIMITGDYPGTAENIARQVGLRDPGQVITGPMLDEMNDAALQKRIRTVNVFARVVPEQKLRLVNALKAGGEIVAMTGDGVNDAPALKAAHIGVAMGGRGTDVAREAAALVLLDDNFTSIVKAVRLGRRIYDNLQKAMAFIVSVHVPIAGISLLPVLAQWPLILLPAHVVFLELIIDPACSTVFEAQPEEGDVMRRPPRPLAAPVLGRAAVIRSLLQGGLVLGLVLAVIIAARVTGHGEAAARTAGFTALVIADLGLILSNRTRARSFFATLRQANAAWWWVAGGTLLLLALVLAVPWLRGVFRFDVLQPDSITYALAAGLASFLLTEVLKTRRLRTASGSFDTHMGLQP